MFGRRSTPNYQKLSTSLRLVISRLKLLEKKKTEQAIKARKDIADYIQNGKEERARIRVEHIIREDYMVEALELIEMYCDLLLTRMGLLKTMNDLDASMEEPIASIIWACPRLVADVKELKAITNQLTIKYGKNFAQLCRTNALCNVNEGLVHKLGAQTPPPLLIEKYMEEISKTYNLPYADESKRAGTTGDGNDKGGTGKPNVGSGSVGGGSAGGGGGGGGIGVKSGGKLAPTAPHADNLPDLPCVPVGTVKTTKGKSKQGDDFDDLSKRFEMLKTRT